MLKRSDMTRVAVSFIAGVTMQALRRSPRTELTAAAAQLRQLLSAAFEEIASGTLTADSHIACRAHAVPLPCRAAKGLECVFPI
jgi:hypothetical protein